MEENWYKRLKEARINAGLSLRKAGSLRNLTITQQTLIKYEKGAACPRIDVLEGLCKKYDVSVDYILYGSSELSKTNDISGQLVSIFMLMHSGKAIYNEQEKKLEIKDRKLASHTMALNTYLHSKEISTIDDLSNLIDAIRKMANEK